MYCNLENAVKVTEKTKIIYSNVKINKKETIIGQQLTGNRK